MADEPTPGPPVDASTPDPTPCDDYSVCRTQDGAQVRAGLSLEDAQGECNILNAQSRMPAGQTADGTQMYGSMYLGDISQYEVHSASGLVI